ncbi:hypothetical protein [Fodinicola acaciae]|uniref:hypothetical protein n=1 Tax=Fodinicola acaciae TaxID=2681555 RepID=UPI0013D82CA1|nr:hypothetical protein [Fodinicola acaciae]
MRKGEDLAPQVLDGRSTVSRHAAYDQLRQLGEPVRGHTPYGEWTWVVTRYDQARAVLADPRISKIDPADLARDPGAEVNNPFADNMLNHDQPEHTRLRKAVQPAFGRTASPRFARASRKSATSSSTGSPVAARPS